MSTVRDVVLAALSEPMTRAELIEATGLEDRQITNCLFLLKADGLIERTGRGVYAPIGSAKPTENIPRIIPAKEPAPDAPETRKRAAKSKTQPRKPRPPPAASMPSANGRAVEFAIAESGAILFKIVSGPRAGELGEIGHVDAMALYRLMSAVEFITENA